MTDNYPTRKEKTGRFIERQEMVVHGYGGNRCLYGYEKDGYTIIKNFFKKEQLKLINQYADNAPGLITNEPKIQAVRSVTGVHKSYPFDEIAKQPDLLSMVRTILGGDIYMHQSRINYKSGINSNGWYWHSDFETWHSQDGMPGMRCLTAMIPLTENTNCNGSLMVIPGSHKWYYGCKKEKTVSAEENFADQKEGVPDEDAIKEFFKKNGNKVEMVICNPGDLVLFDCNIIHGSTTSMVPFPRTNLFFVYNSIKNKLVEPFNGQPPRPNEMGERENIEVL